MGGLPQLPLTTLNSVVAVCALSNDLFPERHPPVVAPKSVAVSVGAMNLAGCAFGVMPCCHGAGRVTSFPFLSFSWFLVYSRLLQGSTEM